MVLTFLVKLVKPVKQWFILVLNPAIGTHYLKK